VSELLHRPLVWVVVAYLVGAVPNGVVLARLRGIDLRKVGSGNIGATNAARALGTKLGLVVFVLDAGKAATPVFFAGQDWALGSAPHMHPWLALIAFATVVGHIFPVYLRFSGGKGVACALGIFVALDPWVAVAAMVMYVQGMWLTRTSAIGSLTAVTSMTLCMLIADKPVAYQALSAATAVLIWLRHVSNIQGLVAEARARKPRTPPPRDAPE
jgi:acyl phosphate:glycerol-3-phosphate acyltransferase